MKTPICANIGDSLRGAQSKKSLFIKKLTAILLTFLFLLSPIAPAFAQEASSDAGGSSAITTDNTTATSPDLGSGAATSPSDSTTDPSTPSNNSGSSVDNTNPANLDTANPSDAGTTVNPAESNQTSTVDNPTGDQATDQKQDSDSSVKKTDSQATPEATQNSIGGSENNYSWEINNPNNLPLLNKASGGLSYSYPIQIPPGRSNFQPNLKLQYDSQQGQEGSPFGYGWNINIPYITRINKAGGNALYSTSTTAYFESSLSGELVPVTPSSTTDYIARVDSGDFLKYNLSNNQWTVTDKQGNQYQFGYDASARQDNASSTDQVYKWMLEKQTDTNGNYISYSYYKDAGQIYPATITYTGNGSTDGVFAITFQRESRTDTQTSYAPSFAVTTNYRINQIQASINNSWVTRWDLSYTTGSNGLRSLLHSVTQTGRDSGGNTTVLPATTFTNQNTSTNFQFSSSGLSIPSDSGFYPWPGFYDFTDVNGDGYTDLVISYYNSVSQSNNDIRKTYLNTGNGGWILSTSYQAPVAFGSIQTGVVPGANPHWFTDINGDGLPDLVFMSSDCSWDPNSGHHCPFIVYINIGSGWQLNTTWHVPFSVLAENDTSGADPKFLDINGDGLIDIVGTAGTFLNTGNGWSQTGTSWGFPASPVSTQANTKFGDLNGDGILDIIQAYANDHFEYPNGQRIVVHQEVYNTWLGDGKGGFVGSADYVSPILFEYDHSSWQCSDGCQFDTGVNLVDVNGDGLPDLVQATSGTSIGPDSINAPPDQSLTTQRVYFNTGKGWSSPVNISLNSYFTYGGHLSASYAFSDFNGDGVSDIYWLTSTVNYPPSNVNITDRITTITHPSGGQSTITYKPTPQYVDSQSALLNPHLPQVINTVFQVSTSDGLGNTSSDTYSYQGGAYYFNGGLDRKFAGFAKVSDTDSANNITNNYYHTGSGTDASHGEYQDNYWKINEPYRTEIYGSSGNLFRKIINKWDVATSTTSSAGFTKLAQTVEEDYDGTTNHKDKAESYTYDNSTGNQIQKIEYGQVNGNDDGTFTDTGIDDFATNITYASDASSTILSSPSDVTVTDHNSNKVKEARYYYDGLSFGDIGLGNQTKEEGWKSGGIYINTQKTYDGTYGLVTQSQDADGNVTNYNYDSYKLYPSTINNALNQQTQYTYNYKNGKVQQTTDLNGNVFNYTYDGLGRMLQVQQPNVTTTSTLDTKIAYTYTDTSGAVSTHESDYMTATSTIDNYTYYDGLNRPIQSRKSTEGSNYETKDLIYDNRGQLQKESLPYFSAGSSKTTATSTATLFTTYAYDPLNRITSSVNNVGTTSNSYNNWKTTTTDPNGHPKDLYTDAYGNLIQVDEHAFASSTYSTYYTYDYLHDLTNITDALSNVRNFTYDGLGRRTAAEDLHAPGDSTYGVWNYTYDDAGNLTSIFDPKSQTINYSYDALNRKTTEDYTGQAGIEVAYTYDSCTQGKGRLCAASSTALSIADVYDALGQLIQETKTIDATNYITGYTYDRLGNKVIITNPDNSQVKYVYNPAGLVNQVQRKENSDSNFTDIVSNYDYSPTEQPTIVSFANGDTTTNTFDPTKLYRLTNKLSAQSSNNNTLQNIGYTYDPAGNITQMANTSNIANRITNSYAYDNLNRLTSVSGTGTPSGTSGYNQNYSYDALGNLTIKSDLGDYAYTGNTGTSYANPHAVTNVGGAILAYDNNGNLTSNTGGVIPWYGAGGFWTARRKIIINSSKVSFTWDSEEIEFPLLVSIIDPDFKSVSNGGHMGKTDGTDMLFTSSDGLTKLSHEIEKYNPATGEIIAWVKIPVLYTGHSNAIIMYYGNASSSDQSNMTDVWRRPYFGANYQMVQHLPNGTALTALDSTGNNNNNGTMSSPAPSAAAGKVDGAASFNGINNYIHFNTVTTTPQNCLTISFWVKPTALATSTYLLAKANSDGSGEDFAIKTGSATSSRLGFYVATSTKDTTTGGLSPSGVLANGVWTYITAMFIGSYNGNSRRLMLYSNGVFQTLTFTGNVPAITQASGLKLLAASASNKAGFFNGVLDEIRISYQPLSYDWINTEYNNQSSTSTFLYVTSIPNADYTWDYLNRITRATTGSATSTYTYDPSNQRIKSNIGTVTTYYPTKFYNITGSTPTKSIFLPDGTLIATVVGTGTSSVVNYIHADNLGGMNVVTNASGTVTEQADYYPYGATRLDQYSISSNNEQRKFTGQEYDASTGLYYMNARYQDPNIGRFVSQDPLIIASPERFLADPQQMNYYSYARNNPITLSDPTGLSMAGDYGSNIGGYGVGLLQGGWSFVTGTVGLAYNTVAHPVQTFQGGVQTLNNVSDFISYSIQDPSGAGKAVSQGFASSYNGYESKSPYEQGKTVGNIFGQVEAGVAASAAAAKGLQALEGTESGVAIHGNSLNSPKLNYGYQLTDQDTGQVVKYGITGNDNPFARYSKSQYQSMNAQMQVITQGSKQEMRAWETQQIQNFEGQSGSKPLFNKTYH